MPRCIQGAAQTGHDHAAHHRCIAESHLGLGRMDIHIDKIMRHIEKQDDHRMAVPGEQILIGTAHRPDQQPVPHRPAIHKQELMVGHTAIIGWQPGEPTETQPVPFEVNRHRIVGKVQA